MIWYCHDTKYISIQISQYNYDTIHIIYALFEYIQIFQQQSQENILYRNDTYLHQFFCITIRIVMTITICRDTRCIVSPLLVLHFSTRQMMSTTFPARSCWIWSLESSTPSWTHHMPICTTQKISTSPRTEGVQAITGPAATIRWAVYDFKYFQGLPCGYSNLKIYSPL